MFDETFIAPSTCESTKPTSSKYDAVSPQPHVRVATTEGTQELVIPQARFLDSCVSHHLTPYTSNLAHSIPYIGSTKVLVRNGEEMDIKSIGRLRLTSVLSPVVNMAL